VDCAELHETLVRGETPSGAQVSAHVGICAACAELVADGGALARRLGQSQSDATTGLPELLSAVTSAVQAERGLCAWLRSRRTEVRVAFGLGAAALFAVTELLRKPRPDLAFYPMTAMLSEVMAYGLVLGLGSHFALRPLQRRAPPHWLAACVALLALGVPVALASLAPAHMAHDASLAGVGAAFVPRALGCFGFGAGLGVLLLVWLRALDRGAHGAGAVVIVAAPLAGLGGNLVLHLHCPITHPAHLFAGHVTVGFALLFAYAAVAHVLVRRPRR